MDEMLCIERTNYLGNVLLSSVFSLVFISIHKESSNLFMVNLLVDSHKCQLCNAALS